MTNTPTNTITPSVTPSISPTNTPTVTPSVTQSVTPTVTTTPTVTPTNTVTPSITPTNTVTPSVSPSMSPTPTNTITPSVTPTNTVTPTPTSSPYVGPCSEEYCVDFGIDSYSGYNGTYESQFPLTYNGETYWTGGTLPGYIYSASTGWCLSSSLGGSCVANGQPTPFCDSTCPDFDESIVTSGICTSVVVPDPCSGLTFSADFYCNVTNVDPCYETRWSVVDTTDINKFTIDYYGNIITGTTTSSNSILSLSQFNPSRIVCPDRGPTNINLQSLRYAGDYRIEFSEVIENPILQILSLGRPSLTTTLSADTPFTIYCSAVTDPSYKIDNYDLVNQKVSANEGNGLIQFSGSTSAITLNYSPTEYVTQLMWGIPCQTPDPSPTPTPTVTSTPTPTVTPTPTFTACTIVGADITVVDTSPTPTPSITPSVTPSVQRNVATGGTVNFVIDNGSFICNDIKELKDCETGLLYYVSEPIEYNNNIVSTGTTIQASLNSVVKCLTYQRDINTGSATAYLGDVLSTGTTCASCGITPTPTPTPTVTPTITPTMTVTPTPSAQPNYSFVFSACNQDRLVIQTVRPGNLSQGDIVTISGTGNNLCYTYLGEFENYIPPGTGAFYVNANLITSTPSTIYETCEECLTPPTTYYRIVKMTTNCDSGSTVYTVSLNSGVSAPSVGDYVRLQNDTPVVWQGCFEVVGTTTSGPPANSIRKVYNQCDCPDNIA